MANILLDKTRRFANNSQDGAISEIWGTRQEATAQSRTEGARTYAEDHRTRSRLARRRPRGHKYLGILWLHRRYVYAGQTGPAAGVRRHVDGSQHLRGIRIVLAGTGPPTGRYGQCATKVCVLVEVGTRRVDQLDRCARRCGCRSEQAQAAGGTGSAHLWSWSARRDVAEAAPA